MEKSVFGHINQGNTTVSEQDINLALLKLPSEFRQKWRDKFDDADDLSICMMDLNEFLKKRDELFISSVEVDPNLSETVKKEVGVVVESIKRTFGDTNYFLGNGYTAEVYEMPIAPHLCVKYIHNQNAYNENNHMRVEYNLLSSLRDVKYGRVRTPAPAFLRIHPSEGHTYGMEKVKGKSLSQILEKPEESMELIKVCKALNRDEIIGQMEGYIKLMHENKITHNDLFMRNIMVDTSGNFFVIDFGKAKLEDLGDNHDDEKRRDLFLARNEISLFFRGIDNLSIK